VSEQPGNGTTSFRLNQLERRVDRLEEGQPAVLAERVRQLEVRIGGLDTHVNKRMDDLDEGQQSQQRALVAAAITFAGSSLLFSFTIWQVFG
jgi:hypothetical protein